MAEHAPAPVIDPLIHADTRAAELMHGKLGDAGIAMLEEQLEIWRNLNERELRSPLREQLLTGDTTLPKGTLLHGTRFNETVLTQISEKGIVSGDLIGVIEDGETNGCADFFKTPESTSVEDYFTFVRTPVEHGNARIARGEKYLTRGVAFIVDPATEGVEALVARDAYIDPDVTVSHLPHDRSSTDTAAILGGMPAGAIAGIVLSDRRVPYGATRPPSQERIDFVKTTFPGTPVFNEHGQAV